MFESIFSSAFSSLGSLLQTTLSAIILDIVLKHLLQTMLIAFALTSFIHFILSFMHFSYAYLCENKVVRIFIWVIFYVYQGWTVYFSFFGYFSGFIIGCYILECCCNIHKAHRQQANEFEFLFAFIIAGATTAYLILFSLAYKHIAIFLFAAILLLLIGVIRKNNFFLSLLVITTMGLIVGVRQFLLEKQSFVFQWVPFEVLIYYAMAFDAQLKERKLLMLQGKATKEESRFTYLFYCASYLHLQCLINDRTIPIEFFLAFIAFFTIAANRT